MCIYLSCRLTALGATISNNSRLRKTSKPKLKSSFVKSLLSPGCQEGQKSSPESRETPKQPAVTNLHTSEKPQHPDTPEPGITHTQRDAHINKFILPSLNVNVMANNTPDKSREVQCASLKWPTVTREAAASTGAQGGSATTAWQVTVYWSCIFSFTPPVCACTVCYLVWTHS